ncbi:hypothetical protein [Pelotomaculum propionicicum]|uniref:Uncharacterized protein n=1 Tax=Pelotomaculum propionicicum TaxID=258475 RepID=A0A4Y7RX20_9FIRM|nr:hypothetical protein [Pelotomaculum propionicicum]TEB13393.1 hypothetical protein Pmgp_00287 [Pelotomaculum propionicicum]
MKNITANPHRFYVFKTEDIEKHLNAKQKENLEDIICGIHAGRMAEGKNRPSTYLVLNIDEPYAQKVWNIMHSHGHTPCSDCHESKKEIFCKPGGCLWYELLSGINHNKKMPNLIWGDENERVCCCCEGVTKEQFIEQVKTEAKAYEVELPEKLEVKREAMISTDKTTYTDTIQPLSGCGVIIEDYWVLEIR